MTNRVEIVIESKDQSESGFSSFDARLAKMATTSGTKLDGVKEKFAKSGEESGKGFADKIGMSLEKGLAQAEQKLAASKARMDKAIALGASDKAKASIEYDVKISESSVAKAKSDIERHGLDMGKRLGDGVDNKGLGARISGIFSKLGQGAAKTFTNESGTLISEGFGNSVKSILTSPAVLGIGAGLAAVLIPAIGAALASGVMLGLGGGVLAAGVMAALKAPAVTAALEGFKTRASRVFADFGKAFEGPVGRAVATFGASLERLSPAFNRIGASAAPLIDKLAPALASLAERAMPGIEHAMSNMGPVFSALASVLPGLGESIGKFFAIISDQGPGTTTFIKDFVKGIGWALENLGKMIAALSWIYGKLRGTKDASEDAGKGAEEMGESFGKSAEKTQTLSSKLAELTAKMLDAASGQLSMRSAARAYEEAIDTLGAAIKKGARGIDEHTAKGRANAAMLDAVASGAVNAAGAAKRMGQSNENVQAIMQRGASTYFRQALALGVNRKAAVDLTASIFGIPAARKTLVEMQNAAKSKAEAAAYAAQLNRIPRNIYTLIQVDRRESVGADGHRIGGYAAGGTVGSAATGGIRNGLTLVGERGPELVNLAPGTRVYNNEQTRGMTSGGGQGGTVINIENLVLQNVEDVPKLVRQLQRYGKSNNGIVIPGGVRSA